MPPKSHTFAGDGSFSWLSSLPEAVDGGAYGSSGNTAGIGVAGSNEAKEGDALYRCLCREVSTGSTLLLKVRDDLMAVEKLCKGEAKATNEVLHVVTTHYTTNSTIYSV